MAYKNRLGGRRKQLAGGGVSHTAIGVGISLLAALLLGAFAFINYKAESSRDGINSKTFCRTGDGAEVTVVLVDHTDLISTIQRASLERHLWDVANSIPKNSAIKVFSVNRVRNQVLTPDIDLCSPGKGVDVSELTGNPRLVQKRFEENFRKPLNAILEQTLQSGSASESPIMEALQSVAVTSFLGESKKASSKRLILVSDLLEHTHDFSMYKGVPDFSAYKSSSHWQSVRSDLNGVKVELFFLHRKGQEALQGAALTAFWDKFFLSQGAFVTNTVRIEG